MNGENCSRKNINKLVLIVDKNGTDHENKCIYEFVIMDVIYYHEMNQ